MLKATTPKGILSTSLYGTQKNITINQYLKDFFYEKLFNKECSIVKKCLTNHALIYARGIMYLEGKCTKQATLQN